MRHTFTNDDAMDSVRRSIYLSEDDDFVVTFSVGYTRSELSKHSNSGRVTRRDVLEAFRELLSADDWEERTLMLWTAKTGKLTDVRAEELS